MAKVRQYRGKWVADWRDETGRRFIKPFADQATATQYLGKILARIERRGFTAPDELPTFEKLAADWLAERATIVCVATIAGYHAHIDLHLVPGPFGKFRVDRISPKNVEAFRRERLAVGLAPQTVNKHLTTASMVFDYAIRHRYIEHNPMAAVERCRRVVQTQNVSDLSELSVDVELGEVDPATVLSGAQARQVIAKVPPGMYQTFLLTAVLTGGRVGELTALTWNDVDLAKGQIVIWKAVSWAKRRDAKTSGPTHGKTKTTAGRRRIPLKPELASILRRWKLACPPTEKDFVFPSDTGETPVHRATIAHKALHPACDAAGIKRVRLHSLRHTFCSTLLIAGRPDTEVAKLAGHRDSSVTRRIYAHWLNPDHDPAALESLDGIATDALAALGEALPAAVETDGNNRRRATRVSS